MDGSCHGATHPLNKIITKKIFHFKWKKKFFFYKIGGQVNLKEETWPII